MVQMLPLGKFFVRNGLLLDEDTNSNEKDAATKSENPGAFLWKSFMHFFLWVCAWSFYILILCGFYVRKHGGLLNMFKRFFLLRFYIFRNFFLMVFYMNILFMILPLAIRLNHRPCFLAFVFIIIYSVLKSYSSGIGNANFYFATAMAYTCFQIILVVETVNSMICHDRKLEKLVATEL